MAHNEHQTFARPASIISACSMSLMFLEYADEHLSLFGKALVEPIEIFASFTCIRSMLEACSIVVWIADPAIDAKERVARVFAHRYEGLEQQLKCARSFGATPGELDKMKAHTDTVEQQAIAVGYPPLLNTKGDRKGIGTVMPPATDLIRLSLGEEPMYRLLSAVAHAHHWALGQLGFRVPSVPPATIGTTPLHHLEKDVKIGVLANVALLGIGAFSKSLWHFSQYMNWDRTETVSVFEKVFDTLQVKESERFWRSASA